MGKLTNPIVIDDCVDEATAERIFNTIKKPKPAMLRLYRRYDSYNRRTILYLWPFRITRGDSERDGFSYMIYLDGSALKKEDIRRIETTCKKKYFEKSSKWELNTIYTTRYRARLAVTIESDGWFEPSGPSGNDSHIRFVIWSDGLEEELTDKYLLNDAVNVAEVIANHFWQRRTPEEAKAMCEFVDSFKQSLINARFTVLERMGRHGDTES